MAVHGGKAVKAMFIPLHAVLEEELLYININKISSIVKVEDVTVLRVDGKDIHVEETVTQVIDKVRLYKER